MLIGLMVALTMAAIITGSKPIAAVAFVVSMYNLITIKLK